MSTQVTRDARLLEIFQESTCFGIAHSDEVPECKQCDVKKQCKSKSLGADIETPKKRSLPKGDVLNEQLEAQKTKKKSKDVENPMKDTEALVKEPVAKSKKSTTPKANADKTIKTTPKKKATPSGADNLPIFKDMDFKELTALAEQRNVEWKEYGNANITRMRLIMALKNSY
ncbi:hypothetical protein EalM132_00115 [Exiguobacterium phage vB_EalM-132]|nr:hypothetical protein EalM132_00115 [Exiguobacterium phage vB_EalM-132]